MSEQQPHPLKEGIMTDASEDREMVVERAMARALAKQGWRRFHAGDSSFANMRYPDGEREYVEVEWIRYHEDAMAALTTLREAGYTVTRSGHGIVP